MYYLAASHTDFALTQIIMQTKRQCWIHASGEEKHASPIYMKKSVSFLSTFNPGPLNLYYKKIKVKYEEKKGCGSLTKEQWQPTAI